MRSSGPLILITGSSDGIGLETARQLARHGADVILHGRRPDRVLAARQAVEALCGRTIPEPIVADLSSLSSASGIAFELARREVFPEILINNAGVFAKQLELSPDGIELSMAVNHFAHFVLTMSLLDQPGCRLRRIINISSIAHNRGRLDWDDLDAKDRFEGYAAYANSKLANVLFAYELAKRLVGTRVTSNALHPGVITTKLLWNGFGSRGDSLERGAATSVKLALDASLAGVSGKYFDNEREARSSPASHDPAAMTRLWEISAERTGASV